MIVCTVLTAGQADALSALAGLAGTNTSLAPAEYAEFYHNRSAKPSNIVPSSPARALDTALRFAISANPAEGCQKVAGGRSGRKGADHRFDARIAMHLGEVPETALPVWELVSLPALKAVV
jgi:hypothetical protein